MKSHSCVIRTSSAHRLHVVTSSTARFQPQNISSQRAENSSANKEVSPTKASDVAMMVHSAIQSSTLTLFTIVFLSTDTSTMFDTTKLIH